MSQISPLPPVDPLSGFHSNSKRFHVCGLHVSRTALITAMLGCLFAIASLTFSLVRLCNNQVIVNISGTTVDSNSAQPQSSIDLQIPISAFTSIWMVLTIIHIIALVLAAIGSHIEAPIFIMPVFVVQPLVCIALLGVCIFLMVALWISDETLHLSVIAIISFPASDKVQTISPDSSNDWTLYLLWLLTVALLPFQIFTFFVFYKVQQFIKEKQDWIAWQTRTRLYENRYGTARRTGTGLRRTDSFELVPPTRFSELDVPELDRVQNNDIQLNSPSAELDSFHNYSVVNMYQ